jgi:hypothetical protein
MTVQPPHRPPPFSPRAVQRLAKQIGGLAQATEGAFLRAGRSLEQAVERFDRLSAPLNALAALADAGEFSSATACAALLESRARAFADSSMIVFGRIAALSEGSDRLQGDLFAMRRVIRTMSIVALNARVTVAALAEQNAGLDVFTTAATLQVVEAGTIIGEISDTVAGMAQRIAVAHRESEALSHLLGAHLAQTLSGLRTDMTSFEAELGRSTKAGSVMMQHSQGFQRAITTAVVALQIGDTTRQRLEHVVTILTKTTETRAEDPALAHLVYALAAAQVRDAHERHAAAITTAQAALRDAGQETVEIGRLAAHAASAPKHNLKHNLQRLQEILSACGASQVRLLEVAQGLSQGLSGLLVILEQMTGVEERMGMIGLNAVIACSQLGDEALALREISLQLRELAVTSADRLRQITEGLTAMGDAAGRTSADLSEGFRTDLQDLTQAGSEVFTALARIETSIADTGGAVERERKSAERDLAMGIQALNGHSGNFLDLEKLMSSFDHWAAQLAQSLPAETTAPVMADLRQCYTMAAERLVHDSLVRAFLPHSVVPDETAEIGPPTSDSLADFFF